MKRLCSVILTLVLLISLCSCSSRTIDDEASPKTALEAALTAIGMKDRGTVYLSETDDEFEMLDDDLLSGKYGELLEAPTLSMMKSYAVFFAFDSYGVEIGVFRMNTVEDAAAMKTFIENRKARLLANAVNYPDLDTKHAESMTLKTDGCWVYYIMSDSGEIAVKEMEKILYSAN